MLSSIIYIQSTEQNFGFPARFRSNFWWKNFLKFFLAQKNRLEILFIENLFRIDFYDIWPIPNQLETTSSTGLSDPILNHRDRLPISVQ